MKINQVKKYYKLTIAYDGEKYCGWQIQKNCMSIHQALMESGRYFLKDDFTITGSSRTDSGVHAIGYVALLMTHSNIDVRKIPKAFNAHLPLDIVVHGIECVDDTFHPRYSSKSKHYRYTIYNGHYPLPQRLHYAFYHSKKLDVNKMNEAAAAFVGTHDFLGFSSMKTTVKDTTRTIYQCGVTYDDGYIHIDIIGDGFLYNMVRIISGSLIEVGLHRIKPEDMNRIIESKDRAISRKTAPANGLTLIKINYN